MKTKSIKDIVFTVKELRAILTEGFKAAGVAPPTNEELSDFRDVVEEALHEYLTGDEDFVYRYVMDTKDGL